MTVWVSLKNWASRIHVNAETKGFWGPPEMMDKYVAKLMLVVTEAAEITEALRKGKGPDAVTEEFADAFIRLLDLHHVLVEDGFATPDLTLAIQSKVEKNEKRPVLHGHFWG
jgi:NTP pyrophosphatase (non-canonical NTP hydrolase)